MLLASENVQDKLPVPAGQDGDSALGAPVALNTKLAPRRPTPTSCPP